MGKQTKQQSNEIDFVDVVEINIKEFLKKYKADMKRIQLEI